MMRGRLHFPFSHDVVCSLWDVAHNGQFVLVSGQWKDRGYHSMRLMQSENVYKPNFQCCNKPVLPIIGSYSDVTSFFMQSPGMNAQHSCAPDTGADSTHVGTVAGPPFRSTGLG